MLTDWPKRTPDTENFCRSKEAPAGSHAIEKQLLKAIEEFTQGTAQSDDITFVMVEKHQ
jgi:serine phosphatase RsbU (regulator of sigma subunit)